MTTEQLTNPIQRFLKKPTRGRAIAAKCAECMGCTKDYLEPGFRAAIKNCTSPECPLYQYRPYK